MNSTDNFIPLPIARGAIWFTIIAYPLWHYISLWMLPSGHPDQLWVRLVIAGYAGLILILESKKIISNKFFYSMMIGLQWIIMLNDARLTMGAGWTQVVQNGYLLTALCIAATAVSFKSFIVFAIYAYVLPFIFNLYFQMPWSTFQTSSPILSTGLVLIGVLLWFQFQTREQLFKQNRSLRLFKFSFENAFDFCIWINAEGKILDGNRSFREVFTGQNMGILNLSIFNLCSPLENSTWKTKWEQIQNQKVVIEEANYRLPSGQAIPVHVTSNWISVDDMGYCCQFVRDLTAQREIERKMEEQRINLIQLSKLSALGEMAGGIAHEINNPLAIIIGKAEQLKRCCRQPEFSSKKLDDMFDAIFRAAHRAENIIKGLKDFSRDGSCDVMELVMISDILGNTLNLCEAKFEEKKVKLVIKSNAHAEKIFCRKVQIQQVLLNLLNNAYDATVDLDDRWIEISTQDTEENLIIKVTDSGQGIAVDLQDKVMRPFFTTKEVGQGTGLSLSISRGIVEAHGGQLWLDTQSKNTSFAFSIPKVNN